MPADGDRRRLPVHAAFHFLGCVAPRADGLEMPSIQGSLIECLADAVEHVTVLAYEIPPSGTLEDDVDYVVRRPNVDWLSLGPKGTWRDSRRRRRRIASTVGPASVRWDVLFQRLPNRRVRDVADASRCPRVVSIDGSNIAAEARMLPMPWYRRIVRLSMVAISERRARQVIASSGRVFVNSASLAERHGRVSSSVEVVPWSLRRAAYAYQTDERLTTAAPDILVCGRLNAAKGIFEAVDAFAAIRGSLLSGARLHIVGDGAALPQLRERVHAHGLDDAVTFHGWVPMGESLFALFRDMDVLLHLSHLESFPRVVWEALAHSILVVCTPVGGLPEALTDRREVLFVEPRNPSAAVEAVRELAADAALRRRLLRDGYARARDTDLERVVERILMSMTTEWPELSGSSEALDHPS